MNTFSDFVPTTLRPEPGRKVLTAKDLRKQLLEISALIKDTKLVKAHVAKLPYSPTQLWTIEVLDNRVVGLMEQAGYVATALASAPQEVIIEHPDEA